MRTHCGWVTVTMPTAHPVTQLVRTNINTVSEKHFHATFVLRCWMISCSLKSDVLLGGQNKISQRTRTQWGTDEEQQSHFDWKWLERCDPVRMTDHIQHSGVLHGWVFSSSTGGQKNSKNGNRWSQNLIYRRLFIVVSCHEDRDELVVSPPIIISAITAPTHMQQHSLQIIKVICMILHSNCIIADHFPKHFNTSLKSRVTPWHTFTGVEACMYVVLFFV